MKIKNYKKWIYRFPITTSLLVLLTACNTGHDAIIEKTEENARIKKGIVGEFTDVGFSIENAVSARTNARIAHAGVNYLKSVGSPDVEMAKVYEQDAEALALTLEHNLVKELISEGSIIINSHGQIEDTNAQALENAIAQRVFDTRAVTDEIRTGLGFFSDEEIQHAIISKANEEELEGFQHLQDAQIAQRHAEQNANEVRNYFHEKATSERKIAENLSNEAYYLKRIGSPDAPAEEAKAKTEKEYARTVQTAYERFNAL